jgi:putative membrane protein
MKLIAKVIITALALIITAQILPGIEISGLYTAIIVAIVLGLLNITVKPILVILTLPITILTLGLFILVINALIFLFAASFIEGFTVSGFLPALIGSIVVSVISTLANSLID